MLKIERNPELLAKSNYDLIIVGGGIYGIATTLEAAKRGLKPLLLEKGDFGEATSWNSLSIVHGGLRYLQTLDLYRFFESVLERRWFLNNFPDLVEPISCLMPLYNKSIYRTSVFRTALLMNGILSFYRNSGVRKNRMLKNGRIMSRSETLDEFPRANAEGLKGAALWHDAVMPNSERVIMEMLRWAAKLGAKALNYVEAKDIFLEGKVVTGIVAEDKETGQSFEFKAPVVINCAGPWCRQIAEKMDRFIPKLFHPLLSFNLLIDREPLSEMAVAVKSDRYKGQVYFLRPWAGKVMAGTLYIPWQNGPEKPVPKEEDIETFIAGLNQAVPNWNVARKDVRRIYAGLIPATRENSKKYSKREVFIDHGSKKGPSGLYSVSGVKFTTARRVAEKVLKHIYKKKSADISAKQTPEKPPINNYPKFLNVEKMIVSERETLGERLKLFMEEESIVHLDDLALRRTDWLKCAEKLKPMLPALCELLGWDKKQTEKEISRLNGML